MLFLEKRDIYFFILGKNCNVNNIENLVYLGERENYMKIKLKKSIVNYSFKRKLRYLVRIRW